ncbi:M56 family metallopeptidase [Streptomyces sp. NPDC058382]|uniref:M56 family metallopeptidase n=1 Tax=unclassified Streptomyces TaxID=2593676 RepID=UPI00363780F2
MGVFVYLPLVLPLTALPVARLTEQHLHPRSAARLLATVAVILGSCTILCLGLLVVVGTAQLPGNPLPDSWSDDEVRKAVPQDRIAGKTAVAALTAVAVACASTLWRHYSFRARARRTLAGLPTTSEVAVLPDGVPYAYALPGSPGRIMVSSAMLDCLTPAEQRVLLAHERAHLAGRHHRLLLAVQLAGCVNPLLRPLRAALTYSTERWADEQAAVDTGDRRLTARAVGKAAIVSHRSATGTVAAFAAAGPVPRRVAALLGPAPSERGWPPVLTPTGIAAFVAAAGSALSTLSSLNAVFALFVALEAATPLQEP